MAARRAPLVAVAAGVAAAALLAAARPHDKSPDVATATPLPAASAETAPPLFVLGDSLSDVGNAAAAMDALLGEAFFPEHTVGLCNPADVYFFRRDCDELFYRKSRVTDGPVAVEHLAAHLGAALAPSLHTVPEPPGSGTNYAVATAKAIGAGPEDFPHQVDRLLLDHGPQLPPAAVVVVMIGGNDAIDALQTAADAAEPAAAIATGGALVAEAADAIAAAVERLIGSGARQLVVANVPDLTALPAVRTRAAATPDPAAALAAADTIVRTMNERLAAALARLAESHPAAAIAAFDLHGALRAARAAPGRNREDACFDSTSYRSTWSAKRTFHPACAPIGEGEPRFAEFVFWDELHPTAAVHAAIAEALIRVYDEAIAPLFVSGTHVASATPTQR